MGSRERRSRDRRGRGRMGRIGMGWVLVRIGANIVLSV